MLHRRFMLGSQALTIPKSAGRINGEVSTFLDGAFALMPACDLWPIKRQRPAFPPLFRYAALPLHPARSVACGQGFYLRYGDQVEIVLDAVLEAGCRRRELHRPLVVIAGQQRVYQAASEAVPAAHAVHDVDPVGGGETGTALDRKSVV